MSFGAYAIRWDPLSISIMFKALVVFLEVAVLGMVLQTSFMQYWLSDIQDTVTGWIETMAQIPEQQEISRLEERIQPYIAGLSGQQHSYLNDVLKSKMSVKHFHRLYCVNGDMNPFIYGATLRLICREIKSSSLLD